MSDLMKIASLAREASVALNNAAVVGTNEVVWGEVRDACTQLDDLAAHLTSWARHERGSEGSADG